MEAFEERKETIFKWAIGARGDRELAKDNR